MNLCTAVLVFCCVSSLVPPSSTCKYRTDEKLKELNKTSNEVRTILKQLETENKKLEESITAEKNRFTALMAQTTEFHHDAKDEIKLEAKVLHELTTNITAAKEEIVKLNKEINIQKSLNGTLANQIETINKKITKLEKMRQKGLLASCKHLVETYPQLRSGCVSGAGELLIVITNITLLRLQAELHYVQQKNQLLKIEYREIIKIHEKAMLDIQAIVKLIDSEVRTIKEQVSQTTTKLVLETKQVNQLIEELEKWRNSTDNGKQILQHLTEKQKDYIPDEACYRELHYLFKPTQENSQTVAK